MKKIIFDLDGTLFFLSGDWKSTYQEFIDIYKLNTTPEELFKTIGLFEHENEDIIVSKKTLCDFINSKINIGITETMLNDLNNRYNNIPLLYTDKVYELLKYLSSKYELIAYTNWFTEDQKYRLEKYDLEKFFSKIYGWDIVKLKPSAAGLKDIVKDNIEDYIMIGDIIEMDMETASNLGIKTILYNRKNITQDKYQEVKKIEELVSII